MSRTVIVTGASEGIGRAAACRFARKGYSTVVNYHRSEQRGPVPGPIPDAGGCSALRCGPTFPTPPR